MPEMKKAAKPFTFFTRLHFSELTGLKAANLIQLLDLIRSVPGSSIYHHTHRFLQVHHYFSPEPPNDFSYWVGGVLGEDELGEKLASIDTIQFHTIRELREEIVSAIQRHLKKFPLARLRFSPEGKEFYFMKSISFILPTNYTVVDLRGFAEAMEKISIDSMYFHIFEARLRLEKEENDFSNWLETALGEKELAEQISRLDPYTFTLDDLKKTLIKIIKKRIPAQ